MNTELALNTQKWRGKSPQQIKIDFATALNEQKETDSFVERLSSGELDIKDGQLSHPIYGTFELRNESLQDKLENLAVEEIIRKAEGGEKHIIWISPPSGQYSESRFLIYLPQKSGDKTRFKLNYISIPGPHDLETCLFTARQLQAFSVVESCPIYSEEELRATPISFDVLQPYESWLELLEDVIYFPEVWQAIKEQKHITNAEESLEVSGGIVAKYYSETQRASGLGSIQIGALMEMEAEKYGYRFQTQGSCGRSNRSLLNDLAKSVSPFTLLANVLPTVNRHEDNKGSTRFCATCNQEVKTYVANGIVYCSLCGEPLGTDTDTGDDMD